MKTVLILLALALLVVLAAPAQAQSPAAPTPAPVVTATPAPAAAFNARMTLPAFAPPSTGASAGPGVGYFSGLGKSDVVFQWSFLETASSSSPFYFDMLKVGDTYGLGESTNGTTIIVPLFKWLKLTPVPVLLQAAGSVRGGFAVTETKGKFGCGVYGEVNLVAVKF